MATTTTIRILPPGSAEQLAPEPIFRRGARMVGKHTSLTFSDIQAMHVQYRGTLRQKKWIPEFALNKQSFRAVVRRAAEKYINLGRIPSELPLEQLIVACNWRTRGIELRARWVKNPLKQYEQLQHVSTCRDAGSYIGLLNYVGYTSWRCVEDSATIATVTGYIRPHAVRQLLLRLTRTARSMGYETPPQHNRKNGPTNRRKDVRHKGFKPKTDETCVDAAWRYFHARTNVPDPPQEITAKDVLELVAWRQEGWKLRSGWSSDRQLTGVQTRIDAGDRLLESITKFDETAVKSIAA